MAVSWGGIVNSYGRIGIEITTSDSNTARSVTAKVYVWSKYGIYDTNNTFYFDWDKTSATTSKGAVSIDTSYNSGSGWNDANKQLIATYTKSYTRTTKAQTINVAAKLTGIDTMGASNVMTISTSFSVPAKPSYTVKYNANGGSGAPSNQTKWYGTNLTLSSTKPTRTGYTFAGWNTDASGTGTNYASGATYSGNAALTLYAKWTLITYTVSYDANGGSGAPGNQTKSYGVDLTLAQTIPTKDNYNFVGWATSANGTAAYSAGGTYTTNAGVTLYAVWELAYYNPKIYNLKAERCDSDGTIDDFGTSCKLSFDYDVCQLLGANTIIGPAYYEVYDSSGANVLLGPVTMSELIGVSNTGSYSTVITNYTFDVDSIYTLKLYVTDSKGGFSEPTVLLTMSRFPLDLKSGGTGVSIGKPAEYDNLFDVNLPTRLRKSLEVVEDVTFQSSMSTVGLATFNGGVDEIIRVSNADCDTLYTVSGQYYMGNSATNKPTNVNGWLTVQSYGGGDYCYQEFTSYTGDRYFRMRDSGAWGSWIAAGGHKQQKTLWSGAYYMNASQTISLSEPISKQANGIVLVWSFYASEAKNYDFNSCYIPKEQVRLHGGAGFMSHLHNSTAIKPALKYVYINDASITGHANNSTTVTASGVTYYNSSYVLRYVLGV